MQYEEILKYIQDNYDDSLSDRMLSNSDKEHIFYIITRYVDAKKKIIEVTKEMAEVLFGLGYDLVTVYEKNRITSSGMANDPFNSLKVESNNYTIYVMKRKDD